MTRRFGSDDPRADAEMQQARSNRLQREFLKLYPGGPRAVDRTRRLSPGGSQYSLPSGSPFGPSRDWGEED